MYGVPANECFFRRGLNYNYKMLEDAGLDPDNVPTTWETLFDWHKTLTKFDAAGNLVQIGLDPYDAEASVWSTDGYAQAVHDLMADLDTGPACGWIVDLRDEHFFDVARDLIALGPLLDDGIVLTYALGVDHQVYSYHRGVVYLNDGFEGGSTEFPRLGLRFRGGVGDALLWDNVLPTGEVDPLTLHAGRPPTQGMKYLLSKWMRDRSQAGNDA